MNFASLPFYNIANMMFIGMQFCFGLFFLFPNAIDYVQAVLQHGSETSFMFGVFTLAIMYEIGIVIDRLASMVLEKILKSKKPMANRGWFSRTFQITWKDYGHYQAAEKHNDAIKTLSREYNYSRNSLMMLIILGTLAIGVRHWIVAIISLDLAIIFYFSMRKHANKIAMRVDYAFSRENESLRQQCERTGACTVVTEPAPPQPSKGKRVKKK